MTPRRLALLRVTPEALAHALGLLPGLRVYRVLDGFGPLHEPLATADIVIVVEDSGGEHLPVVPEGTTLCFVEPERVRSAFMEVPRPKLGSE